MRRNRMQGVTPFQFTVRVAIIAAVGVLAPAFMLVAVAPVLFAILPAAILVLPFLVSAFAPETTTTHARSPARTATLQPHAPH